MLDDREFVEGILLSGVVSLVAVGFMYLFISSADVYRPTELGKTPYRFGSVVKIEKGIYAGSQAVLRYEATEYLSDDCAHREYTALVKRNGMEVNDDLCEDTFGMVKL